MVINLLLKVIDNPVNSKENGINKDMMPTD